MTLPIPPTDAELLYLNALPEAQSALLQRFGRLLEAAGARVNLTSVRDLPGIMHRHVNEALALLRLLEAEISVPPGARIIDVGSGGGLPGLPFAVARPDVSVTLLEATGKKAAFLAETVATLELPNVFVVGARAEEAAREPAHRERYDVAVARAVAALPTLVELTLPFVHPGGYVAAVKGSRAHEEVESAAGAIEQCGGGTPRIIPLRHGSAALAVVLVPKIRSTPEALPRRSGVPGKRPLR